MKEFFVRALNVVVLATSIIVSTGAHAQTTYAQYIQLWKTNWAAYQAEEAIPLPQRGVVVQSVDLPIVIDRPIDKVYAIYANVYSAIGLHPFLIGIIPIDHHQRRNAPTFDFIALEQKNGVRVLFISWKYIVTRFVSPAISGLGSICWITLKGNLGDTPQMA